MQSIMKYMHAHTHNVHTLIDGISCHTHTHTLTGQHHAHDVKKRHTVEKDTHTKKAITHQNTV